MPCMQPEGSLPCSQNPTTDPYPEPDASSPHLHVLHSLWSSLMLSSHLRLVLLCGLFPSGILTKILYEFLTCHMHATCPDRLSLDFITFTILVIVYKLWSSSLCSLLQPLTTYSLLGPNIILNTLFSHTLNLRFSLGVRGQVSHPYKATGRAVGYGLNDRSSMVRFLAGAGNFYLHHRVQTGSGTSYPMGTGGCFPRVKRPGSEVDLTSI
jgi:hypothetical protein